MGGGGLDFPRFLDALDILDILDALETLGFLDACFMLRVVFLQNVLRQCRDPYI